MKTGAQLYTVRLFTQTVPDFRETMRRVAEIGYETVQMSATGSEITPQIASISVSDRCRRNTGTRTGSGVLQSILRNLPV
mgnify:CR=1 FL=1